MDRRDVLKIGAWTGLTGGLGYALGRPSQEDRMAAKFYKDSLVGVGAVKKRWYRYKLIDQAVMDTQLLFWLGVAPSGLTDIGECLDTATRIRSGDERSWFEEWRKTAQRLEQYAQESKKDGHQRSAASLYLRAGAYYRAGLIRYANHKDSRLLADTQKSLKLHGQALDGLGYQSKEVLIPYEKSFLYGRTYFSPHVKRAPFIILHQGLHAWPEDTKWVIDGALERGYHVLSFHGPGQGASLRIYKHPFRPDWEVPVRAVLNFAEQEPRFNMDRAVLMGLSFGGYLAPRAASFEKRLYGLVANPGVLSWSDAMLKHFRDIPGLMRLHKQGPAIFNRAMGAVSTLMPDARWYFEDTTWKHGVSGPYEVINELKKYDNREHVHKIRCKTLIMDGAGEDASPGESQRLFKALSCPKEMLFFDHASAAQTHCQGGGTLLAQAKLFNWMDKEVRS